MKKKVKSKGVDSVGGGFVNPLPMLSQLAQKERKWGDYVSDCLVR